MILNCWFVASSILFVDKTKLEKANKNSTNSMINDNIKHVNCELGLYTRKVIIYNFYVSRNQKLILGLYRLLLIYGTDDNISRKKLAGIGISCINPHTSTISSTEVAGSRSSWKVESTLDVDLRRASSLCRIHSASATDHSFVSCDTF